MGNCGVLMSLCGCTWVVASIRLEKELLLLLLLLLLLFGLLYGFGCCAGVRKLMVDDCCIDLPLPGEGDIW